MYQKKNTIHNSPLTQKKTYSRLGALTLSLVVMMGFVFPVFAETVNTISSPETLLALALLKSANTKSIDADFDMKIGASSTTTSTETTEMIELFNNLSISGNVKSNFETDGSFKFSEKLSYKYLNEELITVNLFLDERQMIVDIPTFLDHSIYADFNDLIKSRLAIQNPDIKFSLSDYYPLLTKKDIPEYDLISLEYGALLIEKIKPSLEFGKTKTIKTTGSSAATYDCQEVILTLTLKEYYTIYFEILNKLLDDPRVEQVVKTKLDAAIAISKENKMFEQFGVTDEQIENIQNDFSTYYAEFVAGAQSELNLETIMATLEESTSLDVDMKFVFYIDEEQNIRAVSEKITLPVQTPSGSTDLDMILNLDLTMVYNNYDDVKVPMPNLTKAYNLSRNVESAMEAIVNDMSVHMATYFDSRPKINELFTKFNEQ